MILASLLWLPWVVQAQPDRLQQTAVQQVIQDYYRAFSAVEKSGNKKAVLQYLDKDYQRNLTYVSVEGETQQLTENYQSFPRYLDLVIQSYQASKTFTTIAFDSLTDLRVTGQTAVAAFQIHYYLQQGHDTLTRGSSVNRFTLKRYPVGWKIQLANLVWMDDQVYKPQCSCRMVSRVNQKVYTVRLVYSEADRYQNRLIHVRFLPRSDYKLILLDNQSYQWRNGQVNKLTDQFTRVEVLGTARTEPEAILLLLQQDVYARYCQYGISVK